MWTNKNGIYPDYTHWKDPEVLKLFDVVEDQGVTGWDRVSLFVGTRTPLQKWYRIMKNIKEAKLFFLESSYQCLVLRLVLVAEAHIFDKTVQTLSRIRRWTQNALNFIYSSWHPGTIPPGILAPWQPSESVHAARNPLLCLLLELKPLINGCCSALL